MLDQPELFQALLNRYSLRAFASDALEPSDLDRIEELTQTTEPLLETNSFGFSLLRQPTAKQRSSLMGMINPHIQPPHILLTWMNSESPAYTNLGYRMEQVSVQLHRMGIGSCFIGTMGREDNINQLVNLPPRSVTGAVLAIGKPASSNLELKPKKRLPLEKIAFLENLSTPLRAPGELAPIMEAARVAPSATNAQPWRLLWKKPELFLFVTPKKLANLLSNEYRKYCLYDGGICMANISMSLKAHNLPAKWEFLDPTSSTVPQHPQELIPLGKIKIEI